MLLLLYYKEGFLLLEKMTFRVNSYHQNNLYYKMLKLPLINKINFRFRIYIWGLTYPTAKQHKTYPIQMSVFLRTENTIGSAVYEIVLDMHAYIFAHSNYIIFFAPLQNNKFFCDNAYWYILDTKLHSKFNITRTIK